MGYGLQNEFSEGFEEIPANLQYWGSSAMLDALAMGYELFGFGSILDQVAEKLNLDVTPLHKVTNPEYILDDFIEGIDPEDTEKMTKWKQRYAEFNARRRKAWQPPSALLASVVQFMKSLDNNPEIFIEIGVDPDRYGNYFLGGSFRKELDKLHKVVSLADRKGVELLRLIWI
jgi:hypothetical protein